MSGEITTGLAGLVGAILGWVSGTRGRNAQAFKIENEAWHDQVSSLLETVEGLRAEVESLRAELRKTRAELQLAEAQIDVLRAECLALKERA